MITPVDVSAAVNAANGLRQLGAAVIDAVRRVRRSSQDDPAPGDWRSREAAYGTFGSVLAATYHDIQLLGALGLPPPLRGAIWSWPTARRAVARVHASLGEGLAAITRIAVVGDDAVLDAACEAAEALAEQMRIFPTRRASRDDLSAFEKAASHFPDRLAAFTHAARADLQRKD